MIFFDIFHTMSQEVAGRKSKEVLLLRFLRPNCANLCNCHVRENFTFRGCLFDT